MHKNGKLLLCKNLDAKILSAFTPFLYSFSPVQDMDLTKEAFWIRGWRVARVVLLFPSWDTGGAV